jgi:hypothetical protein
MSNILTLPYVFDINTHTTWGTVESLVYNKSMVVKLGMCKENAEK